MDSHALTSVLDRERERALGLLVRKGYELELAYEAVRAFERAAASSPRMRPAVTDRYSPTVAA